jgi:hypothetical protein
MMTEVKDDIKKQDADQRKTFEIPVSINVDRDEI